MSDDTAAAVAIVKAVADAIRDLGSVPSGHLYASLMDKMSLETYNDIIDILIRVRLVRRDGSHLLTWIGPSKGQP